MNKSHLELQTRNLIPAPVGRTSASAWSYTHPWIISINDPYSLQIKSTFSCDVIRAYSADI